MPWTCPSCDQAIRRDRDGPSPRPGVTYRCYVCRLDLVIDIKRHKLVAVEREHNSRRKE